MYKDSLVSINVIPRKVILMFLINNLARICDSSGEEYYGFVL